MSFIYYSVSIKPFEGHQFSKLMVSLDDKCYLINYVRNCFVTGDDTAFCELLLEGVDDVTNNEFVNILNGDKLIYI